MREQKKSFRPQQGLTIMNDADAQRYREMCINQSFRPQQGLTIMNIPHNINKQ